jgi:hypothetical protein
MMHGREKSDSAIVAGKPANKAVPTAAEPVEPRAGAKGVNGGPDPRKDGAARCCDRSETRMVKILVRGFLPTHTISRW